MSDILERPCLSRHALLVSLLFCSSLRSRVWFDGLEELPEEHGCSTKTHQKRS